MKHDLKITLFLLLVFVVSQLAGLILLNIDSKVEQQIVEIGGVNQTVNVVEHGDTAVGARPETTGFGSLLFIVLGVAIGTLLILLIIKLGKTIVWKFWFFLAVTMAITISLGVFLNVWVSLGIAIILAIWKILKPNVFVHNISEVLIYSGIALLIVPMFKLVHGESFFSHPIFLVVVLLIIVSIYDAIAVWKSKHMVKMAKFQAESKVFAGLFIPYSVKDKKVDIKMVPATGKLVSEKKINLPKPLKEHKNAILGGGDIAFPLIFTGVVMETLLTKGISKVAAFNYSLIMTLTTTIALFLLLYLSKKDRFYPAMPFITAGCLIGYGILVLLI